MTLDLDRPTTPTCQTKQRASGHFVSAKKAFD